MTAILIICLKVRAKTEILNTTLTHVINLNLKNIFMPCGKMTEDIPPVAILFTTYNVKQRELQTIKVIDYYDKLIPKECMFLVDSANRGVSADKIPSRQQAVFDQNSVCEISGGIMTRGPTLTELCSIKYALETLDFGSALHVIKVTAKYCIPRISCDILRNIDPDADVIVQYSKTAGSQNTEIFGFRLQLAKEIIRELRMQPDHKSNDLEARVHKLISSGKFKVQTLPLMELNYNDTRVSRSDGSFLSAL
tara:strand:+ start:3981 stop:4733 length:753 start_codon:yes stop_codon:yes gene_type:complete